MAAAESLAQRLGHLRRARNAQAMVEYVSFGMLFGVLFACVLVPAQRLLLPQVSAWWSIVVALACGIVGALVAAGLRRESVLAVAIRVDRLLGLKEQLSTAWEWTVERPRDPRTNALVNLALKARVPARTRWVFPWRLNTAARLSPVAVAALLVVWYIELAPIGDANDATRRDIEVVSAGRHLQNYARDLALRAGERSLTYSVAAARDMGALADRMQADTWSRSETLSRLGALGESIDENRLAALSAGKQTQVGAIPLEARADGGAARVRELLVRALGGLLSEEELARLGRGEVDVSATGMSAEQLREALRRHALGDSTALQTLLERLSPRRGSQGDPQRDAAELELARREIDRIRERLGADVEPQSQDGSIARRSRAGSGESRGAGAVDDLDDEDVEGGLGGATGMGISEPSLDGIRLGAPARAAAMESPSASLQAAPIMGEGEVFTGEVRALPRANAVTAERVEVEDRYLSQVESVLSKERVAPRHKALVREYFLYLSRGSPRAENTTGAIQR